MFKDVWACAGADPSLAAVQLLSLCEQLLLQAGDLGVFVQLHLLQLGSQPLSLLLHLHQGCLSPLHLCNANTIFWRHKEL